MESHSRKQDESTSKGVEKPGSLQWSTAGLATPQSLTMKAKVSLPKWFLSEMERDPSFFFFFFLMVQSWGGGVYKRKPMGKFKTAGRTCISPGKGSLILLCRLQIPLMIPQQPYHNITITEITTHRCMYYAQHSASHALVQPALNAHR